LIWGVGLETHQLLRLFALFIWNLEIISILKIRLLLLVYIGGQFLTCEFPMLSNRKASNLFAYSTIFEIS